MLGAELLEMVWGLCRKVKVFTGMFHSHPRCFPQMERRGHWSRDRNRLEHVMQSEFLKMMQTVTRVSFLWGLSGGVVSKMSASTSSLKRTLRTRGARSLVARGLGSWAALRYETPSAEEPPFYLAGAELADSAGSSDDQFHLAWLWQDGKIESTVRAQWQNRARYRASPSEAR